VGESQRWSKTLFDLWEQVWQGGKARVVPQGKKIQIGPLEGDWIWGGGLKMLPELISYTEYNKWIYATWLIWNI
jgi:hypothetical protein